MKNRLAAGLAAVFLAIASAQAEEPKQGSKPPTPSAQAVKEIKPALLNGLTDHNGKAFDAKAQEGKSLIVFFGFTRCPSICPAGMSTIVNMRTGIENRYGTNVASCIVPVFVSTDAAYDTPDKMKHWLQRFSKEAVGLTGTATQLAEVGTKFRALNPKGGHHSPHAYIFDKTGTFKGIVDTLNPQNFTSQIILHINPGDEAFCAPPAPK